MKLFLTVVSAVLFCSIFSCTKTDNVTTTVYDTVTHVIKDTTVTRDTIYSKSQNPIVGLWIGTWKDATDPGDSSYYSYTITANGRMTSTSIGWAGNSDAATGPWQLNGTAFTATLTQLTGGSGLYVQAITGTYDSVAGTLTGSSTFTQGPGTNQTFLLFRVQ